MTRPAYNFDPENPRHWWFDDCPKDELLLCWEYEYSRDCYNLVAKALAWRKETGFPETIPFELFPFIPTPEFFRDWPLLPYLEIDSEKRRIYCGIDQGLANRLHQTFPKREAAARFEHDWDASDEELKRRFAKHLKDRPRDIEIRERRGKRRVSENCRTRLKELGAWRLSEVMSQTDAVSFGLSHDRVLYKDQPALSKAVARVERYLNWLDNH
jgi:hypothetical protein